MSPAVVQLLEEIAPALERLVARDVQRAVDRAVETAIATLTVRDGRDGLPGVPGPAGEAGKPGRDGVDGAAGKDGTLEGVTFRAEGRSVIVTRAADGAVVGTWHTPAVLYRGYYQKDATYEVGDAVTYAGSLWIAAEDTGVRPIETSKAWTLAVKRGEPGKLGPAGPQGKSGDRGAQGLPGVRY
jgi:hypothetical protein